MNDKKRLLDLLAKGMPSAIAEADTGAEKMGEMLDAIKARLGSDAGDAVSAIAHLFSVAKKADRLMSTLMPDAIAKFCSEDLMDAAAHASTVMVKLAAKNNESMTAEMIDAVGTLSRQDQENHDRIDKIAQATIAEIRKQRGEL